MRLLFRKSLAIALMATSPLMPIAQAQNTEFDTLRPYKRRMMEDVIQIRITDRGLQQLETQFLNIITAQGVNLNRGTFKGTKWLSDKTYSTSDLESLSPETGALIKKINGLFTTWLVGFHLNDHRPGIEVGNTGYIAEFKKLSVSADHNLMNSLGRNEGAVLAIDLEIADLKVSSRSIRAFDANNDHLGLTGLDNVTLKMQEDSPTFQLRIPFFVRINPKTKALEFENLAVKTNIDKIKLDFSYQGLIVPELALIINGKRYDLNTETLNTELQNAVPGLIEKGLSQLGDFAQNQLPEILNEKARDMVLGALEQVNFLDAPGGELNDPRGPLRWGLQAQKISLKKDLDISLNGFVEDPAQNETAPKSIDKARALPNLDIFPSNKYDFALGLDRAFINRMMQLSFERGLFSKINSCDGSAPLKLSDVPTIDSVYSHSYTKESNPLSTYIRLKTKSEHVTRSFKEKLVLKSPFEIELDVYAKLTHNPKTGAIDITLESFDYESIKLDKKYLKTFGKMIDGTVFDGIKDEMKNIEKSWHNPKLCTTGQLDTNIIGSVPIAMPLGLSVDPRTLIMDPHGNLLIYMNLNSLTENER